MLAQVLAFPITVPSRGGWSAQELADIYRLSDVLQRHRLGVEIESGVSDEGEPWLVLSNPDDAEVTAHIARIDGRYVVFRSDADDPVHAASLREIVDGLMSRIRGGGGEADSIADESDGDGATIDAMIIHELLGDEIVAGPDPDAGGLDGATAPRAIADERIEQIGQAVLAMIVAVANFADGPEAVAAALVNLVEPTEDVAEASPTVIDLLVPELIDETVVPAEDHADQDTILVPDDERDTAIAREGIDEADIAALVDEAEAPAAGAPEQARPEPARAEAPPDDQDAANLPISGERGAASSTQTGELITGGAGDDVIHGGPGDDTIIGGDGNDVILGGDGNDSLKGDAGDDVLVGGNGDDVLKGGAGSDTLIGGNGADTLDGGAGRDLLISNGGKDSLTGGDGEDLFVIIGSRPGNVTIDDFEESRDRIVVLGADQAPTATATSPSTSTIQVNPEVTITVVGTSHASDLPEPI